jgi:hypothetical protein
VGRPPGTSLHGFHSAQAAHGPTLVCLRQWRVQMAYPSVRRVLEGFAMSGIRPTRQRSTIILICYAPLSLRTPQRPPP